MIGMWIRPARIHLNACKARKKIRRNRLGTSLNVIPVVQADLHFANMTTLQQQYSITNELHASWPLLLRNTSAANALPGPAMVFVQFHSENFAPNNKRR